MTVDNSVVNMPTIADDNNRIISSGAAMLLKSSPYIAARMKNAPRPVKPVIIRFARSML